MILTKRVTYGGREVFRDATGQVYARECTKCGRIKGQPDLQKMSSNVSKKYPERINYSSECKPCSRHRLETEVIPKLKNQVKVPDKKPKKKYAVRPNKALRDAINEAYPDGVKVCNACGIEKAIDEYRVVVGNSTGLARKCEECFTRGL